MEKMHHRSSSLYRGGFFLRDPKYRERPGAVSGVSGLKRSTGCNARKITDVKRKSEQQKKSPTAKRAATIRNEVNTGNGPEEGVVRGHHFLTRGLPVI